MLPTHASIEAGHFYLYPDTKNGETRVLSPEQKIGIQLAADFARECGIVASFLLFVDDYHGNPFLDREWDNETIENFLRNHPDVQSALSLFEMSGIQPNIISELELTSAAAYLYVRLLKRGTVGNGKRNLIGEYKGAAVLTRDGEPTCALIDAALYLRKIGHTKKNPTITVLPLRYKSQQEQVKNILSAFGLVKPPITVIYHDDEGNVLEQDDWSEENIRNEK